jgi:hypothetical protein
LLVSRVQYPIVWLGMHAIVWVLYYSEIVFFVIIHPLESSYISKFREWKAAITSAAKD